MAWRGACGTHTGQVAVAPCGAGRPQRSIQRMRQRQDKERHHHRAKGALMSMVNENDQANRAISKAKLHALLHVHTPPINVVVFHGPDREHSFSGWFPA